MSRRFAFVGVTTGSSSIMKVFPRWREELGLPDDVEMHGLDLPIGAPAADYRRAVEWIRDEPGVLGALVTTHKLDLLRAARDLFDDLDEHARRLQEVSCIAVRDGRVLGWAKDPITARRALDDLLGDDAPTSGEDPLRDDAARGSDASRGSDAPRGGDAALGDVLCMGGGGAAAAISLVLLDRGVERLVITDRDSARLDHLRKLHAGGAGDGRVEYVAVSGADEHDELLRGLRAGALVVNATGLGKDRPGSPLAAPAFPDDAIAWDLNYRGELLFLEQARDAGVRADDGWRYFIYGWTAVMEEVFQRPIGPDDVERLSEAAAFARPA